MITTLMLALAGTAMDPIDVTIAGPDGPLAGTLVDAGADAPTLLLIPGSGPTDRNGDNPMGVKGAAYRQLADGLAAQGVSTLLIDKRGMFGSAKAISNPNKSTFADYVADTRGWIAMMKERGQSCVWLGGHSEGSTVALLAAQDPADICGLVLISGAGSPILDVMRGQLAAQLPAAMMDPVDAAFKAMKAGETVDPDSIPAPLRPMFSADMQAFMISGYTLDPAALLAAIDLPILIVQGEEDVQVAAEEAEKLHAAAADSTLVLLDKVNHILKPAEPGDKAANLATYANPDLAVDPRIAEMIAGFISAER